MKTSIAAAVLLVQQSTTDAFSSSFVPSRSSSQRTISRPTTELRMGLFDGVKDAFAAPPLERSNLDSERETPIDRWMGWSVTSTDEAAQAAESQAPANFVDSMDGANYVRVALTKPMGIVFEENDEEAGGIFVQSVSEGGAADQNGSIKMGDQLIAVGAKKVSGMAFDDALGTIVDSEENPTPLLLFRGTADQFYGPTGASQAWLDEFIAEETTASS